MENSATEIARRDDAEIDGLRRALADEQQRVLRLLADFDNFRKRVLAERHAAQAIGRREALLPMLGVLDTLERALAAGSTDPAFYEGVAATRRLFVDALGSAGAEPIPTLGELFDPKVHEAVATVVSDAVVPGTIAREERSGWRMGNDLLRPAQVVVAMAPEGGGDGE